MHGLVSLLDPPHYQMVEEIWQLLERECGLTGIKVTPFPHFSWFIADDFDWEALETSLAGIASQTPPFTVRCGGLGLFTGPSPVIFIPVLRDETLNRLHRLVWEKASPTGQNVSSYYSPANWTPHISLAYSDVTPENLSAVMQKLAFRSYNWEIKVDNLTLIYELSGQIGQIRYRYELKTV